MSNVIVVLARRRVLLYGLCLLLAMLGSEPPVLGRLLGTTSLTGGQWLVCIVSAVALIVVDESLNLVLHRQKDHGPAR